jgi:hypothetical protein
MKFASIAALSCIGLVSAQEQWNDDFNANDEYE